MGSPSRSLSGGDDCRSAKGDFGLLLLLERESFMNMHSCCAAALSGSRGEPSTTWTTDGKLHPSSTARFFLRAAQRSLPVVILALLPKCPACLAAYVALGTGITLSVPAASLVRMLLMGLCVGSLSYIVINSVRASRLRWLLRRN